MSQDRRIRRRDRSQQSSSHQDIKIILDTAGIDIDTAGHVQSMPSSLPAQTDNRFMNSNSNGQGLQVGIEPFQVPSTALQSQSNRSDAFMTTAAMAPTATPQSTRNRKAVSSTHTAGSNTAACDGTGSVLKPRNPPIAMPLHNHHHHSHRAQLHAPAELAPNSNSTSSTASPGTPFRFETFPASLPRVDPRKDAALELNLYQDQSQFKSQHDSQPQHFVEQMHINFASAQTTAGATLPIPHRKTPFQSPLRNKQSTSTRISGSTTRKRKGSIRKQMAFAEPEFTHEEQYIYSHASAENDSFHDSYKDDSHNTSLSSLSVDGAVPQHHHLGKQTTTTTAARTHPHSFRRGVAQTPFSSSLRSGFDANGETNEIYGSGVAASATTSRAVWLSPILSDEKQKSGTSENTDYAQGRGVTGGVQQEEEKHSNPRTKLNFNSLFSPTNDGSAKSTGGYGGVHDSVRSVARKRNSFSDYDQSPHDDTTPARKMTHRKNKYPSSNFNLYDRSKTNSFPPASGDPIQPRHGTFAPFQIGASDDNQNHTLSPMEEKFRLYLDTTQCSPIKSVPEDGALPLPTGMDMDIDKTPPEQKKPSACIQSPSHSTILSTQSGQESTSTAKSRKLRPMPDMSAFDMGSNATLSSIHNQEFLGDPGSESAASSRLPLSPMKVLCPPTPLRTPAWAYKNGLERSNSLASTKVLAACPPQVIDGFSSLENSLLEDEKIGKSFTSHIPPNNSASIMHSFREDDEDQSSKLVPSSHKSLSGNDLKTDGDRRQRGPFKAISMDSSNENEGIELQLPIFQKYAKQPRLSTEFHRPSISFDSDFDNVSKLGSGAFADVYKARSKSDNQFYALKRNKRQFRGRRDRDRALTEIRIMHRLQTVSLSEWKEESEKSKSSYCLYILFFIRAWQEDGYLYCQTELCCRDTCRHLMLNLTTHWEAASKTYPSLMQNLVKEQKPIDASYAEPIERLVPENTIWKICHDVACGLSHIHSHNIVHHDIKPLNIFFVFHSKLGALCKIGDFGMAGEIGTSEDGQEGDTAYMPNELLRNAEKDPRGDIFSLGITLYELASSGTWTVPTEGTGWHAIRDISHVPEISKRRTPIMVNLIKRMISPNKDTRPNADEILADNQFMSEAAIQADTFLADYIRDVDKVNAAKEREASFAQQQLANRRQTPTPMQNRQTSDSERLLNVRTPTPGSGSF